MDELREAILLEIFQRLPTTSFIQCKSVCKNWYELVSDSNFTHNYVKNSANTTLLLSGLKKDVPFVFVVDISMNWDHIHEQSVQPKFADPLFSTTNKHRKQSLSIIGSCNGLVCVLLREFYDITSTNSTRSCWVDRVYVTNPIAGRCVPALEEYIVDLKGMNFVHYRFCSCPTASNFKVLRNIDRRRTKGGDFAVQSDIFTVRVDDSWRNISMKYCQRPLPLYTYTATCNGAIHWIVYHEGSLWICAFNVDEENCRLVACPSHFRTQPMYTELASLNNHLSLYCYRSCDFSLMDLWVMKEYGVAESWTKHVILNCWFPSELQHKRIEPLAVLKNGDVLLFVRHKCFLSYNPTGKKCKVIKDLDAELRSAKVTTYSQGFSSLKEHVLFGLSTSSSMS